MSDALSSVWAGARQVLGVVAPTIATALGGPLAGTAVRFVTEALGLAPDAAPEDVTAALKSATPEQLLGLKVQEQTFITQMRRLDLDEQALAYADTASARNREVALRDAMPKILAALCVVFTFALTILILTGHAEVKSEFSIMLTTLVLAPYSLVFGYYFGSSTGSKEKTEIMGRAGLR